MTEVHYSDDAVTLWHGDCLDALRELPDESVDAVCTDPPYGLSNTTPQQVADTLLRWVNGDRDYIPSGAGFMGRPWDAFVPPVAVWDECLRVLKPGGHVLAFAGSRTHDLMTLGIRLAGFEIRDAIAWLYGSGFPKSLDVSKAIDGALGARREVLNERTTSRGETGSWADQVRSGMFQSGERVVQTTAPATPEAEQWQGWGTALKPAFEPVVMGRKPLAGTVAANVLAHGTGALNVDGCRVASDEDTGRVRGHNGIYEGGWKPATTESNPAGRWPANVVLDESQAEALDEQTGELTSGANPTRRGADGAREAYGDFAGQEECQPARGADSGGASRFFFTAREDNESCPSTSAANTAANPSSHPSEPADSAPSGAATTASPDGERPTPSPSTSERASESRLSATSGTPATPTTASASSPESQHAKPTPNRNPARSAAPAELTDTTTITTSPSISGGSAAPATSSTTPSSVPGVPLDGLAERFRYVPKAPTEERPRVNGIAHPTTKPLSLMRWLVRLVTPPGGTVLEPFAGSGTTVEACLLERLSCIAIEREADYLPLIEKRIAWGHDPGLRRRETFAPKPRKAPAAEGDLLGLAELADG